MDSLSKSSLFGARNVFLMNSWWSSSCLRLQIDLPKNIPVCWVLTGAVWIAGDSWRETKLYSLLKISIVYFTPFWLWMFPHWMIIQWMFHISMFFDIWTFNFQIGLFNLCISLQKPFVVRGALFCFSHWKIQRQIQRQRRKGQKYEVSRICLWRCYTNTNSNT